MLTHNEAISMLDDLDNMDRQVTDWEADFLDSLLKCAENRPTWVPTERQATVLERMYRKYINQ